MCASPKPATDGAPPTTPISTLKVGAPALVPTLKLQKVTAPGRRSGSICRARAWRPTTRSTFRPLPPIPVQVPNLMELGPPDYTLIRGQLVPARCGLKAHGALGLTWEVTRWQ